MSGADRMRRKRAKDRTHGVVEILVRVPADRADEVRAFAARLLAQMPPRVVPGQLGLPLGAPQGEARGERHTNNG